MTVIGDGVLDPSAAYLLARVQILEHRIRALIALHQRDNDQGPDPLGGLYLSAEHIDRLLAEGASSQRLVWGDDEFVRLLDEEADHHEEANPRLRLRALADRLGLEPLDLDVLVVALAPDLDGRFERLYGYLNDDLTRRRPTVGLALELGGASPWSHAARQRFAALAPLIRHGMLAVEEGERPLLSRTLRVPDRVTAYLLGGDESDSTIRPLLSHPVSWEGDGELPSRLATAMERGASLVVLGDRLGSSSPSLAASAFARLGLPALVVDVERLPADAELDTVGQAIAREALLTGSGLVAGPLDALGDRVPAAVKALTSGGGPVVLHGRTTWEPAWSDQVPLIVEMAPGVPAERLRAWQHSLGPAAPDDLADADVTTQFLLSGDQIRRAAEAARRQADLDDHPVTVEHLRAGARAQNGAALGRLARLIHPSVGWNELVLAPGPKASLQELADRARHRDLVLDRWRMRPGGGRGRGIMALFAGDSGTGKTMSAEVLARDLGLDLYTVNLATVVDKYVGETEKNLERIFSEADGVNAVLLFDEADALFGKRSEVRDANDRYANVEVAYLLQRMETFDGLALLSTNLRANVDDAFARRLDMVIDFPMPDVEQRRMLWDKCIAPEVPRAEDLDLDFCARAFEISGGNIRSIALTAAYLAAGRGEPVTMADLVRAVQREYRKMGRLVVSSEFGDYYPLVGG